MGRVAPPSHIKHRSSENIPFFDSLYSLCRARYCIILLAWKGDSSKPLPMGLTIYPGMNSTALSSREHRARPLWWPDTPLLITNRIMDKVARSAQTLLGILIKCSMNVLIAFPTKKHLMFMCLQYYHQCHMRPH